MVRKNGNVISFDYLVMLEVAEHLEFDQIGRLFEAILNYAKNETIPDFEDDQILNSLWPLIRPES